MGSKVEKNVDEKVRLDKWLWAARFYRTRALAKQAVEGGKVHRSLHSLLDSSMVLTSLGRLG